MIDVIDLKKNFGDHEVLKGINITINKGDIVCVIGPSGCGKSTFLRCLNCMEDPTGGSIIFGGVDIADMKVDINVHRRKMGMVFQQFNLFNNKTVLENIMLAPVHCAVEDRRKILRRNRFNKLKNLFKGSRSEKAAMEPVRAVADIKAEAREKAVSLLLLCLHAHRTKCIDVHINRARADLASSRKKNGRPAKAPSDFTLEELDELVDRFAAAAKLNIYLFVF